MEHFLCKEKECLEKKFVVFRNSLDLQAHNIKTHLSNKKLSKAEEKRARTLSLNQLIKHPNESDYQKIENNSAFMNELHSGKDPTILESETPQIVTIVETPKTREEFERKNKDLITKIKSILSEEEYRELKKLSGDYLQNKLTPEQYYESFLKIMKNQNSSSLFLDLVSLLPDADKRMALKRVQKQAELMNSQNSSTKLISCSKCKKTFRVEEWAQHMESHHEKNLSKQEFPSLPISYQPPSPPFPSRTSFPESQPQQKK